MPSTLRASAGLVVALCLGLGPWALGLHAQDQVVFRIIVVSSLERIEQVAARIRRGEDFGTLAMAESSDASAPAGGLIGPIAMSELRQALRDTLRDMEPGSVRAPLILPTGFAIVQRLEAGAGAAASLALTAAGSVKPLVSVDGLIEVQAALGNLPKPDDWAERPQMICELREQAIARVDASVSSILAPGAAARRAAFTPAEIIEGWVTLGQFHAFKGEMAKSVAEYREAHALAAKSSPASLPDHEQALAAALIHKGEMDNGLYAQPGDRCLLSPAPRPPLARPGDIGAAEDLLLSLLKRNPGDLEARWLLNAGHMSTGGWPARVPVAHRIPESAFASTEDIGRFADVAPAAGIRSLSMAGGTVVDDFDGDGRLDIMTSTADHCSGLRLLRRTPAGVFEDRSAAAGLSSQLGGLNIVHADYNNDRCTDVLVLRGGWELGQRRSLLKNNCNGTFTDVTTAAGLLHPVTSSQTATWTDIDNDGWVDLFVGNENAPSQLFRNRGDGTFTDIADAAGVRRTAFTKGVAAGDFDNDGFADLYVSNFRGGNFLYRNNHDRTFTEVAAVAGVTGPDRGFATWFFDYDNDGWEDIFAASYFVSIDETARSYLGIPLNGRTMKLYRNTGDGRFADVTEAAGLAKSIMTMGSNFGDVDNDGWLDMYLGTGSPSYVSLVPSMLLRNRGGRSFADITVSSGTGEMHKGHGVAFFDFDGDGDQEIAFNVGGATVGDAHAFRLFENPGHGNDWLGVKLVGETTNRAAIGARIKVTVADAAGTRRSMYRTVGHGSSFGGSPFEQHIGLGRAARIVEMEVAWPASGTRQRFGAVEKNQIVELRENAGRFTVVKRPALPLRAVPPRNRTAR